MAVSTEIRTHYDTYYGDARLKEWRRLGAIDKVENIVELSQGLKIESVVDIGCGDGAIIARLSEINFAKSYTGVDISESAIGLARARGIANARFERFDGEGFQGQYDLAIMSHVVEHLENPRTLISAARRIARHVIVEVPCEHNVKLPTDFRPDPTGHINFYTPKTIRLLLQTTGLTVDKQITRGCSLEVMQFNSKLKGTVQHLIRQSTLAVYPRLATSLFCFHTALLCHASGEGGASAKEASH